MPRAVRCEPGLGPAAADDVVECHLLLPAWQADALFRVAFARHETAGLIVRRLIDEFLADAEPASD